MLFFEWVFYICMFLIFFSFVGYPISLFILNFFIRQENKLDKGYKPFISVIIPAHNEEKVIINKLENICKLKYPQDKFEIIVASDNSSDNTNNLVENFVKSNNYDNIFLHKVVERKGKTNAQNEAVRKAKGEILIFTDSNAILDEDAASQLVSSFVSKDVVYVTGRLKYVNDMDHLSSNSEKKYWNYDLYMRKLESNLKTITAGNGALYAIRRADYVDVDLIRSHDSAFPLVAALQHKRAIYNENAIAYEKAGETTEDEFKRKVRMFRNILGSIFKDFKKYNVFKYGLFSYFYFNHRTLRYSLFIHHSLAFISNLIIVSNNVLFGIIFVLQVVFYLCALIGKWGVFKSKVFYYPYYYSMTIVAQFIGATRQIRGKSKPFWEKAETTR